MSFQKLKQKAYQLLPKVLQKSTKNFYYDKIIYPLYSLKYRLDYGVWDFFNSVAIETTTYCNLRCKFCPNSKYPRGLLENKKLMDITLFKKIIDELSEINYGGHIYPHFYGEPLTDERLPELVAYTREKLPKAKIQINTNGFLLTLPLYKKLIDSGVNSFLITQYTNTIPPATKRLLDYLKHHRKENKVKYRILGRDIALSNRGGDIEVEKTVDFERPICIYPNVGINIDYAGNMVLCCNDYHSSIKFGNLKNEKLINIWNSQYYKRLRKQLRSKIFKLPICKKCVGLGEINRQK